ncbi:LysR family transcriptional regulator, partial [Enterobacter hormaechei]|uniref:LysR family transcriptional regulator n=1 Tax=Enterobacter hormaechei TaxID=158836 RepID=UPI003133C76A
RLFSPHQPLGAPQRRGPVVLSEGLAGHEPDRRTRAANQLGAHAAAVSQTFRRWRISWGCAYFHRTSRSVRLSDEGRLFYQKVSPAMSQIDV